MTAMPRPLVLVPYYVGWWDRLHRLLGLMPRDALPLERHKHPYAVRTAPRSASCTCGMQPCDPAPCGLHDDEDLPSGQQAAEWGWTA